MKLKEGRIVTIYNSDDTDPSWTHTFIIVDDNETLIVSPPEIPLDIEKNILSLNVFVEVTDDVFENIILDENGFAKIHKKTMNIREVLSFFGPSKEMKQRLNNGQIKINNQVVKSFDVEYDFDYEFEGEALELADFLCNNGIDLRQLTLLKSYTGLNVIDLFGAPTLLADDTNIEKFEFLKEYVVLSISKKEHYVFKNKDLSEVPYKIYRKKLQPKE